MLATSSGSGLAGLTSTSKISLVSLIILMVVISGIFTSRVSLSKIKTVVSSMATLETYGFVVSSGISASTCISFFLLGVVYSALSYFFPKSESSSFLL